MHNYVELSLMEDQKVHPPPFSKAFHFRKAGSLNGESCWGTHGFAPSGMMGRVAREFGCTTPIDLHFPFPHHFKLATKTTKTKQPKTTKKTTHTHTLTTFLGDASNQKTKGHLPPFGPRQRLSSPSSWLQVRHLTAAMAAPKSAPEAPRATSAIPWLGKVHFAPLGNHEKPWSVGGEKRESSFQA